jgi:hypothetical protein
MSQTMSRLVPVLFEMPKKLWAIHEDGVISEPPFALHGARWDSKSAHEVREMLLAVKGKEDAAEFLDFAGYVLMLDVMDAGGKVVATQPAQPLRPEQVSDRFMGYIEEWQTACREILMPNYRYPSRSKEQSPFGHGTVRDLARRGTGRYNEIPISFTWGASGEPQLTLRPQTTLEAAILSCHADRLAGWNFKQCRRRDCRAIFQVESEHEKFYCSYDCAHLEAVRRGRRKAKKSQRSKKGGK